MGRGSKTGFSNLNPVYAQIKGLKKGETARIEFKTRDPEDETQFIDEGHESGISGKLVGVKDKTYEYEGDEILQAQLILEDEEEGEVYFLSFGMSWVGRNIINSLAGCNNLGEIDISVWNDRETGYAKVHIKNNGEKTEWGYEYDVLKEKINVTTVTKKGKKVQEQDTWDLDVWLLEEVLLKEVANKLPKREAAASEAPAAAPEAEAEEPEAEEPEQPKRRRRAAAPPAESLDSAGSEDNDDPPF